MQAAAVVLAELLLLVDLVEVVLLEMGVMELLELPILEAVEVELAMCQVHSFQVLVVPVSSSSLILVNELS
jgi:hypothetical protein